MFQQPNIIDATDGQITRAAIQQQRLKRCSEYWFVLLKHQFDSKKALAGKTMLHKFRESKPIDLSTWVQQAWSLNLVKQTEKTETL